MQRSLASLSDWVICLKFGDGAASAQYNTNRAVTVSRKNVDKIAADGHLAWFVHPIVDNIASSLSQYTQCPRVHLLSDLQGRETLADCRGRRYPLQGRFD